MLQKYGADALRLYVMFVAPPEKEVEWTDSRARGQLPLPGARLAARRSLGRRRSAADGMHRMRATICTDAERALRRKTHDTIRRVTADIEERQQLNTAVSAMMELVNELYAFSEQTAHGAPARARARRPARVERAQTIAVVREASRRWSRCWRRSRRTREELWEMLGHTDGLADGAAWPAFDAGVAKADEIVVPVQVNGKVRARLTVPADADGGGAGAAGARRSGGAGAHRTARRSGRSSSRKGRWSAWWCQ